MKNCVIYSVTNTVTGKQHEERVSAGTIPARAGYVYAARKTKQRRVADRWEEAMKYEL